MLWLTSAGGRAGLGVGVGVVGPAGMGGKEQDEEGCALIGLGAEIWDIHRGWVMCHWAVTRRFWWRYGVWRGE